MDMDTDSAVETFVKQGVWFAGLPHELQQTILEESELRSYYRGQYLSRESSQGRGLFCIVEGQVALTRWVGNADEILLHVSDSGIWLGELALLLDQATQVNLVAYSNVRALLFPRRSFRDCIGRDPAYFGHFARLGLDRYSMLLRRLAEDRGLTPEWRLRTRLADFADQRLHDRNGSPPVELKISQADVAALVGLSRQTANEILQGLAKEGLVELAFRKITIRDAEALRGDGLFAPPEQEPGAGSQ